MLIPFALIIMMAIVCWMIYGCAVEVQNCDECGRKFSSVDVCSCKQRGEYLRSLTIKKGE